MPLDAPVMIRILSAMFMGPPLIGRTPSLPVASLVLALSTSLHEEVVNRGCQVALSHFT
jgi:hypothetical protein